MPMGYNDSTGVSYYEDPLNEAYLHAPIPQRPGVRISSPSFQEDDLASAQPLQPNNFDPLDGRQAPYPHESFNPIQPLAPSSESLYGSHVSHQLGFSPGPQSQYSSPTQPPPHVIHQVRPRDSHTPTPLHASPEPLGVSDLSSLPQRTAPKSASASTTLFRQDLDLPPPDYYSSVSR